MRKLSIAYGSSCHAKRWVNQQVTFDELCERLSQTVRTPETVEEYPKLPKSPNRSSWRRPTGTGPRTRAAL